VVKTTERARVSILRKLATRTAKLAAPILIADVVNGVVEDITGQSIFEHGKDFVDSLFKSTGAPPDAEPSPEDAQKVGELIAQRLGYDKAKAQAVGAGARKAVEDYHEHGSGQDGLLAVERRTEKAYIAIADAFDKRPSDFADLIEALESWLATDLTIKKEVLSRAADGDLDNRRRH